MSSKGCVTKSFEFWSSGVASFVVDGMSNTAFKGGP